MVWTLLSAVWRFSGVAISFMIGSASDGLGCRAACGEPLVQQPPRVPLHAACRNATDYPLCFRCSPRRVKLGRIGRLRRGKVVFNEPGAGEVH
jgi:hypothetical protein